MSQIDRKLHLLAHRYDSDAGAVVTHLDSRCCKTDKKKGVSETHQSFFYLHKSEFVTCMSECIL